MIKSDIPLYFLQEVEYKPPPDRQAPLFTRLVIRRAASWLERLLAWLRKFEPPPTVRIKTTIFEFDTLLEEINQHQRSVYRLTGKKPKYLFIGRDKYCQATGEQLGYYPLALDRGRNTCFGMTVMVVPWIDGLFCLPDIDEILI